MGTIAFLPWVHFSSEFVINGIKFKPIKIDQCDLQVDILNKVLGVIKPYCLSPIYENPIKEFTLIYYEKLGFAEQLNENQINDLFMLVELIKLVALGQREYFTYGNYFNANNFQLIVQGFSNDNSGVANTFRRRHGSVISFTPEGEFKQFAPSNVNKLTNFNIDIEFIKSLYQAYTSDSEKWEKIYDAIISFNLANADGEMRETTEIVLMCGAFQLLLESGSHFMDFSEKFSDLFIKFPIRTIEDANKVLGPRVSNFNSNLRRAWAADLYQLRGGLAHGVQSGKSYKSSWDIYEHLLLCSFIFPLAVKLKLQTLNFYSTTENDEKSIFSIEYLLAKQDIMKCSFRGDPTSSNWSTQISAAHWAFIGKDL